MMRLSRRPITSLSAVNKPRIYFTPKITSTLVKLGMIGAWSALVVLKNGLARLEREATAFMLGHGARDFGYEEVFDCLARQG